MDITWSNILVLIMLVFMIGICILIIVPTDDEIEFIISLFVNSLPILIPYEQKALITKSLLNTLLYIRNKSKELPKTVTSEIVKFMPLSVVKQVTQGIPNEAIDDSKCKRIIIDTKFKPIDKIAIPENLPWDEKVDYCKLRQGTLDDVNLDEHISDNAPKIILY
jgi:hypothetical protein